MSSRICAFRVSNCPVIDYNTPAWSGTGLISTENRFGPVPCGLAVPLTSTIPAVTCTAQATMLTGVDPCQHGIVGNGWHYRDLNEVWLWRQSQALMQAPHIWHDQPWRVLKHFWWFAMNTGTAATVTPRPVYHQDGRKSPDGYAWPPELKDTLVQRHGDFPLFHFWGSATSIASSRWIAESFTTAIDQIHPHLALCYLPHLDYDLQRYGPTGKHLAGNLREVDNCVGTILDHANANQARVIVVSEYGISAVHQTCAINRFLRERGFLSVIRNATGELIDFGFSRAFAVVDHQIAHITVPDPTDIPVVHQALTDLPGIGQLYTGSERAKIGLEHPRSGEIIALAEAGAWFCHDGGWKKPPNPTSPIASKSIKNSAMIPANCSSTNTAASAVRARPASKKNRLPLCDERHQQ